MKRLLSFIAVLSLLAPSVGLAAQETLPVPDQFHDHSEHEVIPVVPDELKDEIDSLEEVSAEELVELAEESVDEEDSGSFQSLNTAVQQSNLVLQLKQKLAQAQYRYYLLQTNLDGAKENLEDVREMILNLELIIEQLKLQIEDIEDQVLSVKSQTESKKIELEELEEDVQILELKKKDQLEIVQEFMELLYLNRSIYYTDEGLNAVKVLASPQSVSETLQELTYLDLLEEENQEQIIILEFISDELSLKWSELRTKREELDVLDEELANELDRLEEELEAQSALLLEMRSEEAILETMLDAADDNEIDLLAEITALEQSVMQMEELLGATVDGLSDTQQEVITKIEEEMAENYSITEASGIVDLAWPVSPENGLTAYFTDSGYLETFGVQHYALDVRAGQGTPITAAADGVVFDIKFDSESSAYAYIMVAHRKGVMTLAGHISGLSLKNGREIQVGDFVEQGEIIAFTGAMPGSIGAGSRTTGPHLHMEVWQDGARVDPLLYLPLEEVPSDDLPEQYILEMQSDLEDEIRSIQEALGL